MSFIQKYKYHLGLLLIAILAFWQISFFIYPMKYDMIDATYPLRYFIGECIQHGKLPLWNPYINLGSPIHADPSSGAWYPIAWVIGYISGYNIFTLSLEYLLHIFLAGVGFFKLTKTMRLSNNTAFISSASYMLSGIFISNAQHLNFIISACWLPFVLNYYFKMIEKPSNLNSIKAAIFLSLMITGGYAAFTIILFYLLLMLFLYYSIKQLYNYQKKQLLYFIKQNFLFLIISVLLCSTILTATYQVFPKLTRITQFSFINALESPFSPQSTISFLLPFVTVKNPIYFDSDISMTNAYFGVILFIFFLYGLLIKKNEYINILLLFALFSLFAGFGNYFPLRTFLFHHVPMMNLFRFPSVFRLFSIVGFLLVAAFSFEKFSYNSIKKQKKTMVGLALFFVFVFIICIIAARFYCYLNLIYFIKHELFTYSKTSIITQHIAFQSIIQIGILLIFIIITLYIEKTNKMVKLITLLIVIDLFVCTQLNAPYTIFYKEFSAKESYAHLKKSPKGFPKLENINISEIKPDSLYFGPFWKNLSVFQKQISPTGYSPFIFTSYSILQDSFPQLFSEITKNKIAFLSDKVFEESQIKQFRKDSAFTNKTLFFKKQDFDQLQKMDLRSETGDTTHLVYFAPDSFIVKTETHHKQLLTLLQNNYIGWEVYINAKKVPHYTSNKTLISTVVPEGKNTVSFIYKNDKIRVTFYVSLISLFLSLLFILVNCYIRIKKEEKN